MTHDHDHESFENSVLESQESQLGGNAGEQPAVNPPGCDPIRFGAINEDHVKRIVRHHDKALFDAYFDDAASAGWAPDTKDERLRMAGLFHQVIRIGRAEHIGKTIAKAWQNRDSKEKRKGKPVALKLSQADQDFAAKLLRPQASRADPNASALQIVKPLRAIDSNDDSWLSREERQSQADTKARNLATLAVMASQLAAGR